MPPGAVKRRATLNLHQLIDRLAPAARLLLAFLQIFPERFGQPPALRLAAAFRLLAQGRAVRVVFLHAAARSGALAEHST